MFGYDNRETLSCVLGDPTADAKAVLFIAPHACEIVAIKAASGKVVTAGAGTGIALTVYNGGTVGTAETVVGSALGGTSVTWAVGETKSFSLGDGTMAAGEVLWVNYDETGTVAPFVTVQVEYVNGIGAS